MKIVQIMLIVPLCLLISCLVSPTWASAKAAASVDLYKTLGVSRDCNQLDIKKAYHKLALRHHPDKVADKDRQKSEQTFKQIGRAYEVLSDEEKRKLYDQYGEASLNPNFNAAFGAGGGGGPQTFQFAGDEGGMNGFSFGGVDAATFFSGDTRSSSGAFGLDISDILESLIRGQGMSSSSWSQGGFRNAGTGFGLHRRQQQQRQQHKPCIRSVFCSLEELSDPNGCVKKLKVTSAPMYDPATGRQTASREKIYTVHVKPGWKSGTKVKFGATKDGLFPPITFVLKEKPHKFLKRVGNDLMWACTITKKQAKKGAKLKLPLPNGELLELTTRDRVPIKSGDNLTVRGKGMPIKGGISRGNLIVNFRLNDEEEVVS